MSSNLEKVAIVTGGSGGIGSEMARHLSRLGMQVAVAYCASAEGAGQVVADIRAAGGKAVALQADVTQPAQVEQLFKQTIEQFGRVDVVLNNAGIMIPGPIADVSEQAYERVFGVNVAGALWVMRAAARYLQDDGRVVTTSSTMAGAPIPGGALYAASKAAIETMSQVLSKELGHRGITVNAIRVGATVPGMFAKAPPERRAQMAAASPFKRLGAPSDIAEVVAFLVSPESKWITGQVITVDGGAT